MTDRCTADEAAAHVRPVDTIGMPLGPGQPPAFLDALGRRTDWEELRIGGALLTVLTELFSHPNVHYLSGFYGPLERLLRDSGANIGFAPADFRRFTSILEAAPPRIMCTAAAPPDADGWCSLSLHAGASVGQLHVAGADPDRLLVVEVSDAFPRTFGLGEHR
ncbi:MAG: 4-hydroxybutyrate CoA-transferase, partial [Acidimicrobiales bacterium]